MRSIVLNTSPKRSLADGSPQLSVEHEIIQHPVVSIGERRIIVKGRGDLIQNLQHLHPDLDLDNVTHLVESFHLLLQKGNTFYSLGPHQERDRPPDATQDGGHPFTVDVARLDRGPEEPEIEHRHLL